jgi:hypothetical protein
VASGSFAATGFLITMTLSAADATVHIVENPHVTPVLRGHGVAVTLGPARAARRRLPQGVHRADRGSRSVWSRVPRLEDIVFIEVTLRDPSDFETARTCTAS